MCHSWCQNVIVVLDLIVVALPLFLLMNQDPQRNLVQIAVYMVHLTTFCGLSGPKCYHHLLGTSNLSHFQPQTWRGHLSPPVTWGIVDMEFTNLSNFFHPLKTKLFSDLPKVRSIWQGQAHLSVVTSIIVEHYCAIANRFNSVLEDHLI